MRAVTLFPARSFTAPACIDRNVFAEEVPSAGSPFMESRRSDVSCTSRVNPSTERVTLSAAKVNCSPATDDEWSATADGIKVRWSTKSLKVSLTEPLFRSSTNLIKDGGEESPT